jgi:hypothetical protein
MTQAGDADAEFQAMQNVYVALDALDEEARERVLDYVSSRLGLTARARPKPAPANGADDTRDDVEGEDANVGTAVAAPSDFGSLAELYDAGRPKGQAEKALLAGYWLQVCQGADSFDGFSVNKELKHLGEGVANITSALDALKGQKPALALQLKKAGKSRQARKTYKVTVAGIKAVEAMLRG